jgi:radical SAM-linked protein
MGKARVRIRFRKQGDLRLISHRDLACAMERLFRRVGLPVAMSQGFHPKPRINFPLSLALGIEGLDELMEIQLEEPRDAARLLAELREHAPAGLVFLSVEAVADGAPKPRVRHATYTIPVPPDRAAGLAQRVEHLAAQPHWPIHRPGRDEPLNLAADVADLAWDGRLLTMRLHVTGQGNVRPQEVLAALELADLLEQGHWLTRTEVAIAPAPQSAPVPIHAETESKPA